MPTNPFHIKNMRRRPPVHDTRPTARIPIPAYFAPNGPGFQGLYAGDSVEFRTAGGPGIPGGVITRTARVLQLLVFGTHVQVDYGSCGHTVDATNFVRLVRRGKRHIASDVAALTKANDDYVAACHRAGKARRNER